MRQLIHVCLLATLPLLLACPGDPENPPATDAASPFDASLPFDAQGMDSIAPDRAAGDRAGIDAGSTDATGRDLQTTDLASPPDTRGQGEDAGLPPQGDDIIVNGSFEVWTAGLPDGWVGAETSLASDSFAEDSSDAHDGLKSCQLINSTDSHKRFTTAATSLPRGRYHCSYWVRGVGEIRNARYDGDYSSYSSYTAIDTDLWDEVRYDFNVAADVTDVFELVFSVRNTVASRGHLRLDHVRCSRDIEPCDAISCEGWQVCDNDLPGCVTASGFCADADECAEWQTCDADHRCVTTAGRCVETGDCDGATPVCNTSTHLCEAGDPCADVSCDAWKERDPADSSCVLRDGHCMNTLDCTDNLPVCDVTTHTCEAVDHSANVIPNGGFEAWEDIWLWGASTTTYHLPTSWYGYCDGCSPYYPDSELDPNDARPYTSSVHGGSTALQLIKTGQPGDRFETEPFSVLPTATYSCAYWVRGKGSHRQRAYCGGWEPDTQYQPVDSDSWEQVGFEINATSSWCVLILYTINTDSARDHVQFDDVVCSKKF